jgi:thiamine biosynthesis lipoprotein
MTMTPPPTAPTAPPAGGTLGASAEVPAMGTVGHVILIGDDAPPMQDVLEQIRSLEAMWSRFRPDSEVSRLNDGAGRPTLVGHPTAMLLERSVWAWQRTAGLFDPTVLPAVRAAGYTVDFDDLPPVTPLVAAPTPAPGCDGIEVDTRLDLVRLPVGVGIDPGGIGKGLAADLVATAAVDLGADAAMVSLGGDLRVAGDPPSQGWEIELDHHVAPPARVNLLDGAVVTSSTLRRRWTTAAGPAHHVIDPRTGRSTTGPLVACSVLAAEAWWAEALATALLVGWGDPAAEPLLVDLLDDVGALLTFADGRQSTVGAHADSFSPGRSI